MSDKALCELCEKNPASVHYTEIAEARVAKLFICRGCAEERGLLEEGPDVDQLLSSLAKPESETAPPAPALRCSRCGLTFAQFQERGRLGCPSCYAGFGDSLLKLLQEIHRQTRHTGRRPGGSAAGGEARERLGHLRRELELAVRTEDYERAARLRDDIRAAESGAVPPPPAAPAASTTAARSVGELVRRPSVWLRGDGPEQGIVLSTRIRLARNLADRVFPQGAGPEARAAALREILARTEGLGLESGELRLVLAPLKPVERRILGERQLLSQEVVDAPAERGVVIAGDESVSFIINEEDHLRLQALCSGLDLERARVAATRLEAALEERLEFAFDDGLGFLTACPTNTGTGMRASVLLHLPGLVLDNRMEGELAALHRRGVTVRGYHGEGSAALGNFFQVSNALTLGLREEEILERLEGVTHDLIVKEKQSQEALLSRARSLLEDRIWRSYGILRHARKLNAQETLQHASMLRLGASTGILDLSRQVLTEILTLGQEAHTELLAGSDGDAVQRSIWRAAAIRKRLEGSQN